MDISFRTSPTRSYVSTEKGSRSMVARVGEPLYLVISWDGEPSVTPFVQWTRAGEDIPGANSVPYVATKADIGDETIAARGTLPDGTSFVTANAVTIRRSKGTSETGDGVAPPVAVAPAVLAAPAISGIAVGEAATLDFGSWSDADTLDGTLLRDGAEHLTGLTDGQTMTWTPEDAGTTMVLQVTATGSGGSTTAEAAPVTPLVPARRIGDLDTLIFDVGTGDQTVETAPLFEGTTPDYSVTGAGATIDAAGVMTIPTDTAVDGAEVVVTASNAAGSDELRFLVTVQTVSAPAPVAVAPAVLAAPAISGIAVGEAATLDFGSWSDADTLDGTLLRDGAEHLTGLTDGQTMTWTPEDAGTTMVLQVTATGSGGSTTAEAAPVTPLVPARRIGDLDTLIFDVGTGDQTVETAPLFEGTTPDYSVTGAGATIDAAGVMTIPTDTAVDGAEVVVTASNAAGSDELRFLVTVQTVSAPAPVAVAPAVLAAPAISGIAVGEAATLDFGSWSDADTLDGTLLRDGAEHLTGLTDGQTMTWAPEDAGTTMVLQVTATGSGGSTTAEAAPVTPLVPARRIGDLDTLIFDVGTGDQTVETAPLFEGTAPDYSVTGASATIDAAGVMTIPTDTAVDGAEVVVTASNAASSDTLAFLVTIEDETTGEELPAGFAGTHETTTTHTVERTGHTLTTSVALDSATDVSGNVRVIRYPADRKPFTVEGISPASTAANGHQQHGAMFNAWVGDTSQSGQGFDDVSAAGGGTGSDYSPDYSGALNIDPGNTGGGFTIDPAAHPNGCSILKAETKDSKTDYGDNGRTFLKRLTLYLFVPHDEPIPANFLAPGWHEQDGSGVNLRGKFYSTDDWDAKIAALPSKALGDPGSPTPIGSSIAWGHFKTSRRAMREAGGRQTYGRFQLGEMAGQFAALMSDAHETATKKTVAIDLAHFGAMALASVVTAPYPPQGAYHGGAWWASLLLAYLTDDADWIARVQDHTLWHETMQTAVVSDGTLTDYLGRDWPNDDLATVLYGMEHEGASDAAPWLEDFTPGHVGLPWFWIEGQGQAGRTTARPWQSRYEYQNIPYYAWMAIFFHLVPGIETLIAGKWAVFAHVDRYFRLADLQKTGGLEPGITGGAYPGANSQVPEGWETHEAGSNSFAAYVNYRSESPFPMFGGSPEYPLRPDPTYGPVAFDVTTATTRAKLDPYRVDNGDPITQIDVHYRPVFTDESSGSAYPARLVRKPKIFADVTPDGSDWVSLPGLAGGQEHEFTIVLTNVNGSSGIGDFSRTTVNPSATAAPVSWDPPASEVDGAILHGGRTITLLDDGRFTANPAPTFSYAWERTRDGGATIETIAGATTNAYTTVADDIGYDIRPVITATNTQGTGINEGKWRTVEDSASYPALSYAEVGHWEGYVPVSYSDGAGLGGKSFILVVSTKDKGETNSPVPLQEDGVTPWTLDYEVWDNDPNNHIQVWRHTYPPSVFDTDIQFQRNGSPTLASLLGITGGVPVYSGNMDRGVHSSKNTENYELLTMQGGLVILASITDLGGTVKFDGPTQTASGERKYCGIYVVSPTSSERMAVSSTAPNNSSYDTRTVVLGYEPAPK